MAFEVIVSFEHDCQLIHVRKEIGLDFRVYCTGYFDFFIFKEKITKNIVEDLLELLNYPRAETNPFNEYSVIFACNGEDREHLMHFYNYIFRNQGIVFAYPNIAESKETYLYHCLDASSHSRVLESFQNFTFRLESIKEYHVDDYYAQSMFSISDVANDLTRNQMKILTEAYRQGYYEIPRSIRTEDIGNQLNKSRYNIDKTIRIAESKIMKYVDKFLL